MKWLRNKLRQWLLPEFMEAAIIDLTKHQVKELFNSRVKELFNSRVKEVVEGRNLTQEMNIVLKILRMARENAMKEIQGETNSMFFMYPVKKRIPIKEVLRSLIDYLELEMVVYKDKQGELHPKLEQKQYRHTEKEGT